MPRSSNDPWPTDRVAINIPQLTLLTCSSPRRPNCLSYIPKTTPCTIRAQAPALKCMACIGAASGNHEVPEPIRVMGMPSTLGIDPSSDIAICITESCCWA